jgi:hypothetical protein
MFFLFALVLVCNLHAQIGGAFLASADVVVSTVAIEAMMWLLWMPKLKVTPILPLW